LISIFAPLANSGQDWLLVITVPEAEFSGFVTANSRRAALLSLVVVALAGGLAVLLVRQGLRAERGLCPIGDRGRDVRCRGYAPSADRDPGRSYRRQTSRDLAVVGSRPDTTMHRQLGSSTGDPVAGLELSRQEVPPLFEALTEGEAIDGGGAD
jgi:hypothetical protein